MTYVLRRNLAGMGDALVDAEVNALLGDGATPAQAQKIASLMQRTTDGFSGNVDPQYASMVIHADGTIGPQSDAVIPPGDSTNYWPRIFAANRYLVLLNAQNIPVTTVGAISIPAAAAIMATYTPVVGSTSSQAVSTAATGAANQAASTESTKAAATSPVTTTSEAPAPSGAPVQTHTAVYLPYGTPVTLSNGQQGYADGNDGVIAGPPPVGVTASSTAPSTGLIPQLAVDYSAPQLPADITAAAPVSSGFSLAGLPSWAPLAGIGLLAFLILRPSRR